MKLKMSDIDRNEQFQARLGLNKYHVMDLKDAINDGAVLPPVTVNCQDGKYILLDGFHRYQAYLELGIQEVDVSVCEVDLSQPAALEVEAFKLNLAHGLKYHSGDKCRLVRRILQMEEFAGKSNREVAKYLGVSHTLINNVKEKMLKEKIILPSPRAEGKTPETQQASKSNREIELENQVKQLEAELKRIREQQKGYQDLNKPVPEMIADAEKFCETETVQVTEESQPKISDKLTLEEAKQLYGWPKFRDAINALNLNRGQNVWQGQEKTKIESYLSQ